MTRKARRMIIPMSLAFTLSPFLREVLNSTNHEESRGTDSSARIKTGLNLPDPAAVNASANNLKAFISSLHSGSGGLPDFAQTWKPPKTTDSWFSP
jgi:hypothetical protein